MRKDEGMKHSPALSTVGSQTQVTVDEAYEELLLVVGVAIRVRPEVRTGID